MVGWLWISPLVRVSPLHFDSHQHSSIFVISEDKRSEAAFRCFLLAAVRKCVLFHGNFKHVVLSPCLVDCGLSLAPWVSSTFVQRCHFRSRKTLSSVAFFILLAITNHRVSVWFVPWVCLNSWWCRRFGWILWISHLCFDSYQQPFNFRIYQNRSSAAFLCILSATVAKVWPTAAGAFLCILCLSYAVSVLDSCVDHYLAFDVTIPILHFKTLYGFLLIFCSVWWVPILH